MAGNPQDFLVYAGDKANPSLTAFYPNGTPIDLTGTTAAVWNCQRDLQSAAVLSKSLAGAGIVIDGGTGGTFKLAFAAGDTGGLSGFYIHAAVFTLASGNVITGTLGRFQVGRAPIWSYSGDPANSDRDNVRSLIGDIIESDPLLMDPQIDSLLTQFGSPFYAAAQAARIIGAQFARKVNKKVGDLTISYSDLSKQYYELATQLNAQAGIIGTGMYAGGTSKSDMKANAMNSDRPTPPFRLHQFDNKGAAGGLMPPNGGGAPDDV